MKKVILTAVTVTLFAVLPSTQTQAKGDKCQAYCAVFRTGPIAIAEIQLSSQNTKSQTVLHDDLGVVKGATADELKASCQALADESMSPFTGLLGDTLRAKLLVSLSVESSGGLTVVTESKDFTECEGTQGNTTLPPE